MFKTIDVLCYNCESKHIQSVDVPSGTPLPDEVTCDKCGAEDAKRLISATIHKAHIEQALHGDRLADGRIVSRSDLGARSAAEQTRLNKLLKYAKKSGDKSLAQDVNKELAAKKAEVVKKL